MSIKSRTKHLISNQKNEATAFWFNQYEETSSLKAHCRSISEEEPLNELWWLEGFCLSSFQFLNALSKIQSGEYYRAWCELEQIEIHTSQMLRNKFCKDLEARAQYISNSVSRWQSLFPYKIFLSPEFLIRSRICSVCKSRISPWNRCGHKKGKVYRGQLCSHIVTDVEMQATALVLDPVQKYSVVFPHGVENDTFDYGAVRFVRDRLRSPWDGWQVEFTRAFHPHEKFDGTGPSDACPCLSGRTYNECCLSKPGVLKPHARITFDVEPPSNLPNSYLPGE